MPSTKPRPPLSRMTDEAILDLRFRDLGLSVHPRTFIARMVKRLDADLEAKGLRFRPHIWLGTEWFSPDGVPGIAAPFYLAHPRLMKIEQKQMLKVEGGSGRDCIRILRHEAGHCFDTAYRLHRRARYRSLFGKVGDKYPDEYQPDPTSRKHVQHLEGWYAQSHPAEDFAETFAVWLGSDRWRTRYRGWPALRKLLYVDELMHEIADQAPAVRSGRKVESIASLSSTLREHYRARRMLYADDWPDIYDPDLMRVFSSEPRYRSRPSAPAFLRSLRVEIREDVSAWTGAHPYTIDQLLRDMIDRCKELHLRLALSQHEARTQVLMMLTAQTMRFTMGKRPTLKL